MRKGLRTMAKIELTAGRVTAHKCKRGAAQGFLWDTKAPGLAVRATAGAKAFIFQGRLRGKSLRVTIGDVKTWDIDRADPKHPGARQEARRLQALLDRGIDPRDEKADLAAAAEARRAAQRAAESAASDAGKHTLGTLFAAYVAHLRKQGKQAAYDAENMFANHVTAAHPATAATPANAVAARDVVALLRPLTEAGKGRTAAKLRSYLRAAYALAARAALDSDAPAAFIAFAVEANPVQATGALSKYSRALERALSAPELYAYWQALADSPDSPARDALLLLMLLGGQRPAQLLRATVADVDLTGRTITQRDPKGKREQPRVHVLPLTDPALIVVKRCIARAEAQQAKRGDAQQPRYLFSTHGGAPLRPETITRAAADIAAALIGKPKAARIVNESFGARDLRRTAETRLAELGISRDLRAQLQSHGLSGIQQRHYDKYSYANEKRAALEAWAAYLAAKPAGNVRQIRGRKRA